LLIFGLNISLPFVSDVTEIRGLCQVGRSIEVGDVFDVGVAVAFDVGVEVVFDVGVAVAFDVGVEVAFEFPFYCGQKIGLKNGSEGTLV
jgi:hypothetical protein